MISQPQTENKRASGNKIDLNADKRRNGFVPQDRGKYYPLILMAELGLWIQIQETQRSGEVPDWFMNNLLLLLFLESGGLQRMQGRDLNGEVVRLDQHPDLCPLLSRSCTFLPTSS